jgi:predicted RND superfamily exporter protein
MMISSIAIGIGIDYTIHVTSRLKMEYSSGKSTREALKRTMLITGRAIIVNTISVMLGFIVLMFSTTVPLRRFGWLTASTMLYSLLGALIIVPALILVTGASYMKKHSAG